MLRQQASGIVTNDGGWAQSGIQYAQPASGSTTIVKEVSRLILEPAGTISAATVVMPADPVDGQSLTIATTQIITTLTHTAGTGQTIVTPLTAGTAGGSTTFIYRRGARTFTFTTVLAVAATSATLSANWDHATGVYAVTTSTGETKAVTLTNGATTATWTGGLGQAATATFTVESRAWYRA